MHSFIIQTSQSNFFDPDFCQSILKKYLNFETNISNIKENIDLINIGLEDRNSIGIEMIRELKPILSKQPMVWPYKIIWLTSADKMTIAAQNAILKILEEPPKYIKIFLLVINKSNLLETIISRCQNIDNLENITKQDIDPQLIIDWQQLSAFSVAQRIDWTDKNFKDKQSVIEWLSKSIYYYNDSNDLILLKMINLALSDITRNINYKLALGHMWLNWPSHS